MSSFLFIGEGLSLSESDVISVLYKDAIGLLHIWILLFCVGGLSVKQTIFLHFDSNMQ